MKKFKQNKADCYISEELLNKLIDDIADADASQEFKTGASTVLSFMTCPKTASMHGTSLKEYIENSWRYYLEHKIKLVKKAFKNLVINND